VIILELLRIVLCDSNPEELKHCEALCRSICEQKQIPAVLTTFTNGQELLFEMMDSAFSAMVNILVLEPFNGCEMIADVVRKNGYDGIILYLSWAAEKQYFYQAFDAKAFNYVEKSGLSRFAKVFERALEAAREQERQYVALSCAGEYRQIDIRDIYYFETSMDHMICVRYAGGKFLFQSSLSTLESRLKGRGFFRTHRSYLVSLGAVRQTAFDQVTLVNGATVPIGRGKYAALKDAMEKWYRH